MSDTVHGLSITRLQWETLIKLRDYKSAPGWIVNSRTAAALVQKRLIECSIKAPMYRLTKLGALMLMVKEGKSHGK